MGEWKSWCRLCAIEDISVIDIFKEMEDSSCIAADLKQFCNLKLENSVDLPTKICNSCNVSINDLKDFLANSIKTQQMFADIVCNSTNDCHGIRKKYKLKVNNTQVKNEPQYLSKDEVSERLSQLKDTGEENKTNKKHDPSINQNLEVIVNDLEQDNFEKQSLDHDLAEKINGVEQGVIEDENEIECEEKNRTSRRKSLRKPTATQKISKKNTKIPKILLCKENKSDKSPNESSKSEKYTCQICENSFSSQGGLTNHLKIKHSVSKDPQPCKFCGKKFERLSALKQHEFAHLPYEERKQLSCPHCDKKFNSESGRWSHIHSVHTNRKAVICEECGKEFATKHHLAHHKVSHQQEKKWQCPHCPAKFKGKVGLQAHMDIHGESFPCPICGLLLNTKQLLKKHMIVHSDEKKYKCNFCNKDFKRLNELNYHLITHIGIKPFECRICGEKFVHDMTYRRHLKSTHATEFAEMIAKGERISIRNFPPANQLKAINEAAKNTHEFSEMLSKSGNNIENAT